MALGPVGGARRFLGWIKPGLLDRIAFGNKKMVGDEGCHIFFATQKNIPVGRHLKKSKTKFWTFIRFLLRSNPYGVLAPHLQNKN